MVKLPRIFSKPGLRTRVPKPRKVGKIMAQYLQKAVILHTFRVQVGLCSIRSESWAESFGLQSGVYG